MPPLVLFDTVSFDHEKNPVLTEASFSISRGEFIGMIGPNGGGKTTALKLMMGFLKPKKGKVLLFDSSPKEERKRIGYVPQMMELDKAFPISVEEVVLTGLLSKVKWWGSLPKEERKKGDQILEEMGIAFLRHFPFGSLSGGQIQKVLIARALVSQPDLLLLDEATAHIDPHSEEQIFELLKNLKGKPTILIVSHNFEAIMKHTERVLLFQKEVSSLSLQAVCEHFAMGMYHPIQLTTGKEGK